MSEADAPTRRGTPGRREIGKEGNCHASLGGVYDVKQPNPRIWTLGSMRSLIAQAWHFLEFVPSKREQAS